MRAAVGWRTAQRAAVLGPARGRDRARRLRALPAREPAQAGRGGPPPGGAERRAGGRARAPARHPRGAAAAGARCSRTGVSSAGLNVAYVVSNAALTVGWLMRLYAAAASRVPSLPPRRRADDARLPAGLLLLPLRAAALPRPPRRHDRRRERASTSTRGRSPSSTTRSRPCRASTSPTRSSRLPASRRRPRARCSAALAPAYPPLVAAVVFVTANHYVLDAVAGAAVAGAALRLSK